MKKIQRLEIKNFLGIESLEIEAGKINKISGGNGKGKTSVLDAIAKGILNTTNSRPKLVKDQEEESEILLILNDGTEIKRNIKKEGNDKLNVSKDGATIPRPETFLKGLTGTFIFNPVDFISMKDKEQTEILLNLVDHRLTVKDLHSLFGEALDINLDKHSLLVLKELEKAYFDKRALANKSVKITEDQIFANFENLPDNFDIEKAKEIDLEKLYKEKEEKKEINFKFEKGQEYLANYQDKLKTINAEAEKERLKVKEIISGEITACENEYKYKINNIEQEIQELKNKLEKTKTEKEIAMKTIEGSIQNKIDKINDKAKEEVEKIQEIKNKIDKFLAENKEQNIEDVEIKIKDATEKIGFIKLAENKAILEKELINYKIEAERLNIKVELCREMPARIISSLNMPIKDLGINEEGLITIKNLPIKNLSTKESILLSLEVARATAGELKLINVDRFESLDADAKEIFLKEIEKDDFQYFITEVTAGERKIETINPEKIEEKKDLDIKDFF